MRAPTRAQPLTNCHQQGPLPPVNRILHTKGWTVLRVWAHELRLKDEPKLIRRQFHDLGGAHERGETHFLRFSPSVPIRFIRG